MPGFTVLLRIIWDFVGTKHSRFASVASNPKDLISYFKGILSGFLIAFLLLKGLSLKEIAAVRETTEKTACVQSMAVYDKVGISSRSELSAFFLEDLLVSTNSVSDSGTT